MTVRPPTLDPPSHAPATSLRAQRPWLMAGTLAACIVSAAVALAAEGKPPRAEDAPLTISAGPDWLPLEVNLDIEPGSALDFSNVVPRHAPAGKFGRVVVTQDGKFAFENRAAPVRFYGVDLCCTAQFLSHELSDRLAERLVRLGYNAVRIHHYERWLVDRASGEIRLRASELDQFDYLFAAFKQRGIDVAADPLTQAAERAGLCLFLRGDLQPAKHSVAITSTPEALLASAAVSRDRAPAWSRLAWLTRVGWRIGDASQAAEHDL